MGHFYLAERGHFYLAVTHELRIMYIMLNAALTREFTRNKWLSSNASNLCPKAILGTSRAADISEAMAGLRLPAELPTDPIRRVRTARHHRFR